MVGRAPAGTQLLRLHAGKALAQALILYPQLAKRLCIKPRVGGACHRFKDDPAVLLPHDVARVGPRMKARVRWMRRWRSPEGAREAGHGHVGAQPVDRAFADI